MNKDLGIGFIALFMIIFLITLNGFFFFQISEQKEQIKELNIVVDSRLSQYNSLYIAYTNTYADVIECKGDLNNLSLDYNKCKYDLDNYVCDEVVLDCDIKKYNNGCEDVPKVLVYNKQSHYPCYWIFRHMYQQYGNYLDVGTICMNQQLGWGQACDCVNDMAGDVYAYQEVEQIFNEIGYKIGDDLKW